MLSTMKIVTAFLFMGATTSCSAPPKAPSELLAARSAVSTAKAEPLKLQFEDDTKQASIELAKAEKLLLKEKDLALVKHRAYLATQYSALVTTQADNVRVQKRISNADEQRQALLLKAQKKATGRAEKEADKLSEELAELKSENTARGLLLTISDVLFDSGSALLKSGSSGTLDRISGFLKKSDAESIIIEGHTDSSGDDKYNMTLSQNRAFNVRAALIARGVSAGLVSAFGKGENNPVVSNNTEMGRQQNRRVEIVVNTNASS